MVEAMVEAMVERPQAVAAASRSRERDASKYDDKSRNGSFKGEIGLLKSKYYTQDGNIAADMEQILVWIVEVVPDLGLNTNQTLRHCRCGLTRASYG